MNNRPLIKSNHSTNKMVSRSISALKAAGLNDKAKELLSRVSELKANERGLILDILQYYVTIE